MHVRDTGEAFAALVASDATGCFNIGSGEGTPVREIARLVAEATGRPDLLRLGGLERRADDPAEIVADVTRLAALGWAPVVDLEAGVRDTVAWCREA